MESTAMVTAELLEAGYLQQENVSAAQHLLEPYFEAAVEAADSKKFALEDEAQQAKVIQDAQDLAESDLEMGQIEDRFVQAGVIEAAADLREKDEALFERADAMLAATCAEAAQALSTAGLIGPGDLASVTKLVARLWNPQKEDDQT